MDPVPTSSGRPASWRVQVGETDERYRSLAESSPDGILISEDGRIRFLNPAAVRLLGAAGPEEILGKSPFDIVHPEYHSLVHACGLPSSAARAAQSADARIVRLDGAPIDVELTCARLDDSAGRAIAVIARDITERKRTEAALRESEERLRLAFAGAQEGVWDWDLETGAVVYSPRWKHMLGYADDEIESHVDEWKRLLHPDDKPRAEQLNESVLRGGETYEGEFRLRHKDGHFIHVLSRGYPVRRDPNGPVVRIVGIHLDITDRKRTEAALRESEERLRLAFAGAQEGVWDWNLETGAVVYSPRWKQMLGYSDEEIEPHVDAWKRLLHPDDKPRADQLNQSVLRGSDTYEGEFRLRHKDGHFIHVLSRGFPVRREPGGPVVRIVGTHFDLTERKRAEAEHTRTEFLTRLVFAQEDERRRIAREMHDQFGEHLTALGHGIGMLRDACGDRPELRAKVEVLDAVALGLDRDVDHLVWEIRPTALDDLGLRAALANYVQTWSARVGISAQLHAPGPLDDRLASETETTLYRIAQEALNNIAKHSRAGHVDVILERRPDSVLLIIEDNGVGFDPGGVGSDGGFGLVGMQERAALVGATLQIESTPGKGTTIFVRLPAPAAGNSTEHA
jgi:PAS domain S-box-containing protein